MRKEGTLMLWKEGSDAVEKGLPAGLQIAQVIIPSTTQWKNSLARKVIIPSTTQRKNYLAKLSMAQALLQGCNTTEYTEGIATVTRHRVTQCDGTFTLSFLNDDRKRVRLNVRVILRMAKQ